MTNITNSIYNIRDIKLKSNQMSIYFLYFGNYFLYHFRAIDKP